MPLALGLALGLASVRVSVWVPGACVAVRERGGGEGAQTRGGGGCGQDKAHMVNFSAGLSTAYCAAAKMPHPIARQNPSTNVPTDLLWSPMGAWVRDEAQDGHR